MSAGYSSTPLAKRLGFKPGMRCAVVGAVPDDYADLVGDLPAGVVLASRLGSAPRDLVHLFCRDAATLRRRYDACRDALTPAGMLWVSWPKKASGIVTDITEDVIRDHALANGLVDVKVCAVDETWSALKLVRRLADR